MNKKLKTLVKKYQDATEYSVELHKLILAELSLVLEPHAESIAKEIDNAPDAKTDYQWGEHGEIERVVSIQLPNEDDFANKYGMDATGDIRQVLNELVSDLTCAHIDFDNSVALQVEMDAIIVQTEGRKTDRGVYTNNKRIINETEYLDDNDQIDTTKRNQLIEEYMDKTGYYPSVFTIDYYGTIQLIKTY